MNPAIIAVSFCGWRREDKKYRETLIFYPFCTFYIGFLRVQIRGVYIWFPSFLPSGMTQNIVIHWYVISGILSNQSSAHQHWSSLNLVKCPKNLQNRTIYVNDTKHVNSIEFTILLLKLSLKIDANCRNGSNEREFMIKVNMDNYSVMWKGIHLNELLLGI